MEAPSLLRGRRPFLAPLWLGAIAAVVATAVLFGIARVSLTLFADTTTVIVLRHAERFAIGEDPGLTPEGETRAQRLAQLLARQRLAAIYVSDTARTQATAAPLAAVARLTPIVRPGRDVEGVLEDIGERFVGRTVVIVGHSNTVPQFVERLTRGELTPAVEDDEFDVIYIVTVTRFGPPSVTTLRY
jgi:broad specificity phosphatase PhoE